FFYLFTDNKMYHLNVTYNGVYSTGHPPVGIVLLSCYQSVISSVLLRHKEPYVLPKKYSIKRAHSKGMCLDEPNFKQLSTNQFLRSNRRLSFSSLDQS